MSSWGCRFVDRTEKSSLFFSIPETPLLVYPPFLSIIYKFVSDITQDEHKSPILSRNTKFQIILVEQGCGNKTSWTESNVLAAKCQNKHLCNTKKLFNESLFCLNKAKDMLVVSKKSLKQCNEECYFRRLSDGRSGGSGIQE